MRPIHHVCSTDDLRPALKYFEVRGGIVYATDCHIAIRFPVSEVFPEELISDDETLYFNAEQWKRCGMYKADRIERKDNTFTAYDKKNSILGIMEAITGDELWDKASGRFPDINAVCPTDNQMQQADINHIMFDPKLIGKLASAYGDPYLQFAFQFYGGGKPVRILTPDFEGDAIIMPLVECKWYEERVQSEEAALTHDYTAPEETAEEPLWKDNTQNNTDEINS